jgi:hypothetical protein
MVELGRFLVTFLRLTKFVLCNKHHSNVAFVEFLDLLPFGSVQRAQIVESLTSWDNLAGLKYLINVVYLC